MLFFSIEIVALIIAIGLFIVNAYFLNDEEGCIVYEKPRYINIHHGSNDVHIMTDWKEGTSVIEKVIITKEKIVVETEEGEYEYDNYDQFDIGLSGEE